MLIRTKIRKMMPIGRRSVTTRLMESQSLQQVVMLQPQAVPQPHKHKRKHRGELALTNTFSTINIFNGFTKLRKPKFDSLLSHSICFALQNAKCWLPNISLGCCPKPAIWPGWKFCATVSHDGTNLCFYAAGTTQRPSIAGSVVGHDA